MNKSHGWQEIPLSAMIPKDANQSEALKQLQSTATRMFHKGACRVLVSREMQPKKGARLYWHLSISCQDRYPTWNEIKDARYSLLPMSLTFAQLLPPMDEFVNIHPNCFHLWEIDT